MSGGALVLALSLTSSPLRAASASGGVLGFVEDPNGMPVQGAVISLFRGGAASTGLITLSDSAGRFFLPSLPAGSYTLRALRPGHAPAPMRQVVVLPNQDATFTVSLTPLSDAAARTSEARAAAAEEAARETKWLLRHKRRSVLEARRERWCARRRWPGRWSARRPGSRGMRWDRSDWCRPGTRHTRTGRRRWP